MGRFTARLSQNRAARRVRKVEDHKLKALSQPQHQAAVRRIAFSSGGQILAAIASGLISILAIRILTSRLGTEGYGQYIILLSIVTAAALIVDLGLNGITFRDLARSPDSAGRSNPNQPRSQARAERGGRAVGDSARLRVVSESTLLFDDGRSCLLIRHYLTVVQTTLLTYYEHVCGVKFMDAAVRSLFVPCRCLFHVDRRPRIRWHCDRLCIGGRSHGGDVRVSSASSCPSCDSDSAQNLVADTKADGPCLAPCSLPIPSTSTWTASCFRFWQPIRRSRFTPWLSG